MSLVNYTDDIGRREEYRFGMHTVSVDGDVAFARFIGDESPEEATEIAKLLEGYMARLPRLYVMCDVHEMGEVSSGTRRAWILWFKSHNPEAVVITGAGIGIRTVVKLIVGATRVFTGKEPRFVLVGTENEGRAWIEDYKRRVS